VALVVSLGSPLAFAEDNAALVKRLDEQCSNECRSYKDEAEKGSVRASQEVAACVGMCFYRGLPAGYPNRDKILEAAKEAAREARKLGSNAPVVKIPD